MLFNVLIADLKDDTSCCLIKSADNTKLGVGSGSGIVDTVNGRASMEKNLKIMSTETS